IYDQGRVLDLVPGVKDVHPLQLQVFHIFAIDLLEFAVSLARVATGVSKPVLRFLVGVEDAVIRDLGLCSGAGEQQQQEYSDSHSERFPFKVFGRWSCIAWLVSWVAEAF
ncbi:MAG: hypothetical protein QOJ42_3449, partial [Acidobacteriaceae bacterium]|nr:hypothetical protein [Acidobacteriaceae bacterium]